MINGKKKLILNYRNQNTNYLLSKASTGVIVGAHDSIVSPGTHRSLEESVHHSLSSCNVLLIVGNVEG